MLTSDFTWTIRQFGNNFVKLWKLKGVMYLSSKKSYDVARMFRNLMKINLFNLNKK